MKCPKCDQETYIDHTEQNAGVTTYVYVCVNPKCPDFRKGFKLTGEEVEAQIKE